MVFSIDPEDGFVILRPRIGIFDFEQETIVKPLNLVPVGSRYPRVWLVVDDALSSVTWCGGHPVRGAFGIQIDDVTVLCIKNPADGGWGCAWGARFGEGNRLPEAEVFELLADCGGVAHGFEGAHFTAAAGALERVAAPDDEDALPPAAFRSGQSADVRRLVWTRRPSFCHFILFSHTSGFFAVETVVANGLEAFGRNVFVKSGDEVGAGKYLKVPFGAPAAGGAVEDGLCPGIPIHFLEGDWRSEEVLGEPFDSLSILGSNGGFALVDVEAVVLPAQKFIGLTGSDPLELE